MTNGKAAAQAGHAWCDCLDVNSEHPDVLEYRLLRPGTKIALDGGSGDDLMRMAGQLALTNVPHVLIHDEGHIEPPDFDGSRILTALGIGPFPKGGEPRFLRKLPKWRGGCAM